MLLELALDEDYHVRKAISEVVESQKASSLIFEQILQDCVSSKMPEMMNLVILFYKNLQKVSKRHLNYTYGMVYSSCVNYKHFLNVKINL